MELSINVFGGGVTPKSIWTLKQRSKKLECHSIKCQTKLHLFKEKQFKNTFHAKHFTEWMFVRF